MKALCAAMLAASLFVIAPAQAQIAGDITEARGVAEKWLKLVDSEEYAQAYAGSAAAFRDGKPKFAWTTIVSAAHIHMGAFVSRTLETVFPSSTSVAFRYASNYENGSNVRESVTTTRDKDGSWRVSAYSISDVDSANARPTATNGTR